MTYNACRVPVSIHGVRWVGNIANPMPSILNWGGCGDGLTDNAEYFIAAEKGEEAIYVPKGMWKTSYFPRGKYYGEGKVLIGNSVYYLDPTVATSILGGTYTQTPDDDNEDNEAETAFTVSESFPTWRNIFIGPKVGLYTNPSVTQTSTVIGDQALSSAGVGSASRITGVGKHVFGNARAPYSCDAFGADALGEGLFMNRCTAIGANAMKWVGTPDPIATLHDFWLGETPNCAGLDDALRWPTIRTDFLFLGTGSTITPTSSDYCKDSVAVGRNALLHSMKTVGNTAIGYNSLAHSIATSYNTAVGVRCLRDCAKGSMNTAMGTCAMLSNISGNRNVAIGFNALSKGNHISANVAIGFGAGQALAGTRVIPNEDTIFNVFVGHESGLLAVGGKENTGVGYQSMKVNTTGTYNTGIGSQALSKCTEGSYNSALGYKALQGTVTGSFQGFNNCTGVGAQTKISNHNQVQLGDSSTTTYAFGAIQDRSDQRDKADIQPTLLGLDFIKQIEPVDFKWDRRDDYIISNPDGTITNEPKNGSKKRSRFHHGVIAQQVKQVCDKLGVDFGGYQDHKVNGGEDVLTIGYSEFIGPLIKSVQQLSAQLKDLDTRILDCEDALWLRS